MLTALAAGRVMGEHKSRGDASLLCLQGRAVVHAGDANVELGPGDLVAVPPQRHDVEALDSSVLRLTVALHWPRSVFVMAGLVAGGADRTEGLPAVRGASAQRERGFICSQLSRWLPTTTTSCFSDETIVSVSEEGHAP
ncbi:cupin domain-containing protein [Kribbella steppae]|uniref:cupin domain-containing protein n=1 Tax=Kribbella steppae TaxID=2512223 RepID=UPI0034E1F130